MKAAVVLIPMFILVCSCGRGDSAGPGDGPGDQQTVVTGQGTLVVRGEASSGDCTLCPVPSPDGLSHLTPAELHIGVAAVELLRSADDADPAILWSAQSPQDADLMAGATFAQVDLASVPAGTYTHLRVNMPWIRYVVPATGHVAGMSALPGTLEVDYALGSYDDQQLGPRLQGDYLATFSAGGFSYPESGTRPVVYPPPYPGGSVDTAGGAYRVTFPIPGQPLVVSPTQPLNADVDVTYYIRDAFGWQEKDAPGFQTGVFDLSMDPQQCEQPMSMGIRGFSIQVLFPG